METITCARCGETKPLSDFHSDASKPGGKEYHCRRCSNKASTDWKKRHPEANRAHAAKWRANNPEKHKEMARQSYLKNRDKRLAGNKAWREANVSKMHDYGLQHSFGLMPGTYATMLAEQGGRCAICGTDDPGRNHRETMHRQRHFHVDHCHDTGAIRGLLCHGCNVGIGNLKHDVAALRAAIDYLEKYSPTYLTERRTKG